MDYQLATGIIGGFKFNRIEKEKYENQKIMGLSKAYKEIFVKKFTWKFSKIMENIKAMS